MYSQCFSTLPANFLSKSPGFSCSVIQQWWNEECYTDSRFWESYGWKQYSTTWILWYNVFCLTWSHCWHYKSLSSIFSFFTQLWTVLTHWKSGLISSEKLLISAGIFMFSESEPNQSWKAWNFWNSALFRDEYLWDFNSGCSSELYSAGKRTAYYGRTAFL